MRREPIEDREDEPRHRRDLAGVGDVREQEPPAHLLGPLDETCIHAGDEDAQILIGARRDDELEPRVERVAGVHAPEKACGVLEIQEIGVALHGEGDAITKLRHPLREQMVDSGGHERLLRRVVVKLRAARDSSAPADLDRRRASIAALDERPDRRFEQPLRGLRRAFGLGRHRSNATSLKQTVKPVCFCGCVFAYSFHYFDVAWVGATGRLKVDDG